MYTYLYMYNKIDTLLHYWWFKLLEVDKCWRKELHYIVHSMWMSLILVWYSCELQSVTTQQVMLCVQGIYIVDFR